MLIEYVQRFTWNIANEYILINWTKYSLSASAIVTAFVGGWWMNECGMDQLGVLNA